LILILSALALCLSIVNAQCVNGVIMAQYAGATIPVTATTQQNYTIAGCPDPTINIRIGFTYTFTWTLPNHPFGIYNASGLVWGNVTAGPLDWTPSFEELMAQGYYYKCGNHPNMMGGFNILPPANIAVPMWGNVTAELFAISPVCLLPSQFNAELPRFCDPLQNAFAVQCENVSDVIMPVSYACNDCRMADPVCDKLAQNMWPPNDMCAPSSQTTSGKFTCGAVAAPTMEPVTIVVPTEAATVVATGVATVAPPTATPATAVTLATIIVASVPPTVPLVTGAPATLATPPPVTAVSMMPATPVTPRPSLIFSSPKSGAAAVGLAVAAVLAAVAVRL